MSGENVEKKEPSKEPNNVGMSGRATLTLRDAKTGEVKQQVTTNNMILARGLDWIISHIISGSLEGSTVTEGQTSTYHGEVGGATYILGRPDTNPFKCLSVLNIGNGNTSPAFEEGRGNTLYYMHKNTGAANDSGVDVETYNERIGDSDSGNKSTSTHEFTSVDPSTRTKILGWKYISTDLNGAQSTQSNEDASMSNQFQRVYLVFNFDTDEGNGTINSLLWSDAVGESNPICCGARLAVSPSITKTSADTLDITYTFELIPS